MKNKKQQLQKLKNERGLTLVELLAVIVILGIISTIAFVMIGNVIDNAKKDAHIANAQQVISAAKLYEVTDGDIGKDGIAITELKSSGYIDDIIDPWTKKVGGTVATDKVTEDNGVYSITLSASETKYNINDVTEEKLREGRDEVYK